ncbi:cohesin complex subunit, putative [Candida dubliniensis CD36]|uniref:Cohesin complex subunit, putative n=1 Tax=Candida dubliniensis (strain CD36 / ATCC MYA-646 / CBS 7987 / NCPF 3949 / NRRL Y-17841) TaxID=573826 RepID=B9WA39_CANDC|nr:cohesin complex subunit, putative [Candida dubliniensis CD36]CAX45677.1 cohesin complex subunit, putative [Candida dubliniensis CD36]
MARRSTRRQTANPVSYRESSDSEAEEDFEHEEEEDYRASVTPRSTKRKSATKSSSASKKRKKSTTAKGSKKSLKQLEEELEENYLYKALSSNEANIQDIALDWIEEYEEDQLEDKYESITGLINFILRCCGSLHLFQPHDLSNLESCADTVDEIGIAFGEQSSHKYPFKAVPVFKKNALQLFKEIIDLAHEKGLLYKYDNDQEKEDEEDSLASPLMSYILTWVTSLSSSPIRPLRYTSTEILFAIQFQLCKIIKSVESSLERSQRQLSKIKKSNKSKYNTISKTIESCQLQKRTILEYFNDTGNIVIDRRYRDIDPQIRLACLKNLCEFILIYPDFFCQGIYLRYFGWLLSDPIAQVRIENTRSLLKLYRSISPADLTLGLRQFSEKYKLQIIKMSQIDTDTQVRLNIIGICCELLRLGFLEEGDTRQVVKNFPFSGPSKLQIEGAKFITILNEENLSGINDKYKLLLETYKPSQFEAELPVCLEIRSLISILKPVADKSLHLVFQNMSSRYESSWEILVKYFLSDISSMKFTKREEEEEEFVEGEEIEEFKQFIDLNSDDRLILLKFVEGFVEYIYTKKNAEEVESQLVRLTEYLSQIQNVCVRSSKMFPVFLITWTTLLKSHQSVYSISNKLDKLDQYDEISSEIIKYFKEFDTIDEFSSYFTALFDSHGLTTNIKLSIQTVLEELSEEVVKTIGDQQPEDDDVDSTNIELLEQTKLIKTVEVVSPILQKIKQMGDFVNIANLSNMADLLSSLVNRVLRKLDLALIMAQWKHNFVEQLPQFLRALTCLYDLTLVVISWKFEKLVEIEKDEQHHYAMDLEFDEIVNLVNQTIRLIYECTNSVQFLDLKTLLVSRYIDFVLSFKVFYVRFQADNGFDNFQEFFNNNMQLLLIKKDMQFQLLELFLIKEVRLGHLLNVELDRDDEEDVNYEDYTEKSNDSFLQDKSMFDDDAEDDPTSQPPAEGNSSIANQEVQAKKKEKIWNFEKDLSVYTLKLISLVNVSLVQDDLYNRIKLNKDKLGSVFSKIIQQQDEHANNIKNQAVANEEQDTEQSRMSENVQPTSVEDSNGNEVVERDESIAIEIDVPESEPMIDVETSSASVKV